MTPILVISIPGKDLSATSTGAANVRLQTFMTAMLRSNTYAIKNSEIFQYLFLVK